MKRISTYMKNFDMQYHLRLREWRLNEIQNKIASQTRIKELRNDPVSAAHATRYSSRITRMERFSENVATLKSRQQIAEGYMQEALDILQRVREIAVTGATGTFTKQEKQYMGEEVNQLLNELVEIANASSGEGTTLFAGSRNLSKPFRVSLGNVPGGTGEVIVSVEYTGNIQESLAEISEGSYIKSTFAGNRVFWAEHQVLMATRDATNYQVSTDSAIYIDGHRVELKTGDNIHAIIAKINDSNAPVKAKLDPVTNALMIETTTPHQLWLEDGEGCRVLRDLGLLSDDGALPPHNISDEARISGGSAFDMLISLRGSLYRGDTIQIGGSALKGIDNALNNLLNTITDLGSKHERLELVGERLAYEIPEMVAKKSREVDLDITRAITELKMLESAHRAALQTAGRILQPTLLDFLR